jgi:hypothetical protein
MTDLQKYLVHDGDCSCYQLIFDGYGQSHDCYICDCGALRNAIRNPSNKYSKLQLDKLNNCWANHMLAITKT